MERDGAVVHVFPGYGGRPRATDVSPGALADDVVATHEGPLDLIAVGSSGLVAQFVLMRHAERVNSAVIATSSPWPGGDADSAERCAAWAAAARAKGMASVADEALRLWFTPHAVRYAHPAVELARKALLATDRAVWADYQEMLARAADVDRLAAFRQPVSIVAGSMDAAVAPDAPARLHAIIPNSRLAFMAAPHMVHLEAAWHFDTEVARHFMWSVIGNRVDNPVATAGE